MNQSSHIGECPVGAHSLLAVIPLLSIRALASFVQPSTECQPPASTVAPAPHKVPSIARCIRTDGRLDEGEWKAALRLELTYEIYPGDNTPPPVETTVYLQYSDKALYVAFRCADPDPDAIRAHYSDRDHIGNDDYVAIMLDTFNDQRRSYQFAVSPRGVQSDCIKLESIGVVSWDGVWKAAGSITGTGYEIEMEIPFRELAFARSATDQSWGFDAVRGLARSQQHYIGFVPRDRNSLCYLCQLAKISGFRDVVPGHDFEITPTLTSVLTEQLGDQAGEASRDRRIDTQLGITQKWNIAPNLVLGSTVNPDFSHVEADALQLDVNEPFALYYPERRPFFTEGAGVFETPVSAVYTRSVRDPQWGLRFTGRDRCNALGVLVVRDRLTNLIFPGSEGSRRASLHLPSTAGAFRYERGLGDAAHMGILLTDRESSAYHNRLLGIDGSMLLARGDRLRGQGIVSRTRYPASIADTYGQSAETVSGHFLRTSYDHQSRTLRGQLAFDDVTDGFRADLGFVPMVGYRRYNGYLTRTWDGRPTGLFTRLNLGCQVAHRETQAGALLEREGSVGMSTQGSRGSNSSLWAYQRREVYGGKAFDLSWVYFGGGVEANRNTAFSLWAIAGDRIDYIEGREASRVRVGASFESSIARHLKLSGSHDFEVLSRDSRRLYTAGVSEVRAVWYFSARTFSRVVVQNEDCRYEQDQYSTDVVAVTRNLFLSFLFAHKIDPRTVLFLGCDTDQLGSDAGDSGPSHWTLYAKLGYALRP